MTTDSTPTPAEPLKPCPFCGAEPRQRRAQDESLYSHATVTYLQIVCDECDAQSVSSEDHDDVIARWNRRATPAAAAEIAQPAVPEPPKPLDDPHLQQVFGWAIEGAIASGYQNTNPPPAGHWLEYWWQKGRGAAPREAPDEAIDAEIGKRWRTDSSLEKWFPLTAERLADLEAEVSALRATQAQPATQPGVLTDEQIERHTLLASQCPPDSKVLLVSSVRRLRAAIATQAAQQPKDLGDASGPGSTSLRSSDPYRDLPTSER